MSRQSSEEESSRKFAEFNLVVNITNQNIGGQKSRSASRKSKRGNNVDNNLKYVRIEDNCLLQTNRYKRLEDCIAK